MNKSKFLPLMALLMGFGLVFSMSAFKAVTKQSSKNYYHITSSNTFVSTAPDPDQLSCKGDDVWCQVTYSGPSGSLPTATSFAEGSIPAAAAGVTRTLSNQNRGFQP